ncbi:MAG: anaerobic ribonucleoside-triphosphate reductase activating protein, partial [Angelakisella sp.]
MLFGGIQRTSTIDFPGTLAAVLFVRGCNLDCFYCHNRGLLSPRGEALTESGVKEFLEKRKGLLDGIVVSGGEPTVYEDLPEFLTYLKKLGYKVKLDTNGQRPAVTEELAKAGLADYFAVDFKALPRDSHFVTGSDLSAVNSM